MKPILLAISVFLAVSYAVASERSTNSTGVYETDLHQVLGAIWSIKFMQELCAETHPQFSRSNEAAYTEWRRRHLAFLQEMERHWRAFTLSMAKGDVQRHIKVLADADRNKDQLREGLRRYMAEGGPDDHRKTCQLYRGYVLTGDRANLPLYYEEQVRTIRRAAK